jgi:phosphate transport system permease protein
LANHTEALRPGGPPRAAHPALYSRARLGRRALVDRVARKLVTLGGITIIASILAILFVIAAEVYPLFRAPSATLANTVSSSAPAPLAVGLDEYREVAYIVTPSGVQFVQTRDGAPLPTPPFVAPNGTRVTTATPPKGGAFVLGLSDGRVIPVEIKFSVTFPGGKRQVEPQLIAGEPIMGDPKGGPIRAAAHAVTKAGPITAVASGPKVLTLVTIQERKALIGPPRKEGSTQSLTVPLEGEITALALDGRGEDMFVGSSTGQVVRVDLRDPAAPRMTEPVAVAGRAGAGVTVLGFLNGDRTLVVGDTAGGVSTWQLIQEGGGDRRLIGIHRFPPHPGPVVAFDPSRRDKGFLTADATGNVHFNYGTTGQILLAVKAEGDRLAALGMAPKADGLVAAGADGRLFLWTVNNPHPEITLKSLFGKVWYEGYASPAYVWQSTGGTDDFEAKFSLTPLIYGTLKGTFYALVFAVPLALLAALYASQFMHPALKGYVKPTVEIMAGMPSVVLGFIAGLWLAPLIERVVPGVFLMPVMVPVVILLALGGWQYVPFGVRRWFRSGSEVFFLIPVVAVGAWLAFALGSVIESSILGGDYRAWLQGALGITYDQRNSLVVGFVMGFAVIPIIFTIAEDSLSSVPQHLVAGSLALGATRWQTAIRVVLPSASPGIFSAIMIGFGRAVGETMIVLMATGNTPVMDWSIFNGFRALSANIAVELPEAPEGGTLFRVLFLAAFLLFVMTFIVNTAAELVRLRLRKRYQSL